MTLISAHPVSSLVTAAVVVLGYAVPWYVARETQPKRVRQ